MASRLTIEAGAAQGETFSLDEFEAFTIGRETTNDLVVPDWITSRQHCIIRRESDGFCIEDLNSHNGTFLNGLPITKQCLKNGDRIYVGTTRLRFEPEDDNEAFQQCQVEISEALTTQSDLFFFPTPSALRSDRELNLLVKFGKALDGLKDPKELAQRLLEIILDVVPAKRGAILVQNDGGIPVSLAAIQRNKTSSTPLQISRTVTQMVLRDQVALRSDVVTGAPLSTSDSLITSQVRSLLCIPLSLQSLKGFVYLDSDDAGFSFTEAHMYEMTAVAGLISAALVNARRVQELKRRNERLQAEAVLETNMIGECQAMRDVFVLLAKIARSDVTTLLLGESGTGKELAARALHQNSARREGPFIAINCALLSPTLLESEVFGHEKGAFTGATAQKKGKFELADTGTIFLDEVAEIPLELQAKLLRFLQEREFERVGGTRSIKVDVRVLAATNRNLREAVQCGKFREDLFFRLNVMSVRLPPLRERLADIPLLVEHFIKRCAARCKRVGLTISDEALAALGAYDWPGNVRELENAIEGSVVLSSTDSIELEDLPEAVIERWVPAQDSSPRLYESLKTCRRKLILEAIEKAGGNYTVAAGALGIHPNNLHRMMRNLGLRRQNDKRD